MSKPKSKQVTDFLRDSYVAQGFLLVAAINMVLLLINPVGRVDPEATQSVRTWAWWAGKDYRQQKEPVNVLLLGSSFVMNPTWLNEAVYRNQDVDLVVDHRVHYLEDRIKEKTGLSNLKCFNFGLPGAMVSDQCMILKSMCKGDKHPDVAVLFMAPRDLMDCRFNNAGLSKHFRYLSKFTEDKDIASLQFNDLNGRFTDIFSNAIYFKTKAQDIQALAAQKVRTAMRPLVAMLPPSPLDQKSEEDRRNVFKRDEIEQGAWTAHPNTPYWYVDSSADCKHRYKHMNDEVYENQKKWLDLALATCRQEGIKPMIVHVPSSTVARQCMHEGIYERHAAYLEKVAREEGIPYLNLDPVWVHEKQDFTDWGHMSPSGGAKMLSALGDFIAANQELETALADSQTNRKVAGKDGGTL